MKIYHNLFKLKNFLKRGRKLPLRSDLNMDKVYEIVSDESPLFIINPSVLESPINTASLK